MLLGRHWCDLLLLYASPSFWKWEDSSVWCIFDSTMTSFSTVSGQKWLVSCVTVVKHALELQKKIHILKSHCLNRKGMEAEQWTRECRGRWSLAKVCLWHWDSHSSGKFCGYFKGGFPEPILTFHPALGHIQGIDYYTCIFMLKKKKQTSDCTWSTILIALIIKKSLGCCLSSTFLKHHSN